MIRKVFHIAIVAVFVTGMRVDVDYLKFCSAALLVVFILLEVRSISITDVQVVWSTDLYLQAIRVSNIHPIASFLEECFKSFRDEKDSGPLTLTHIYLLVGMSLPLWMHPTEDVSSLAASSGIISIGFGDTAASLIGNLFGSHRWSRSKKTIEGTIGAIIAQIVSSIWLLNYFNESSDIFAVEIIIPIIVISILVAVIEAKTSQIDNLILPLYHYLFVSLFKLTWNEKLWRKIKLWKKCFKHDFERYESPATLFISWLCFSSCSAGAAEGVASNISVATLSFFLRFSGLFLCKTTSIPTPKFQGSHPFITGNLIATC